MKPEHLTDLFTRAETSELGISLTTNNPERMLQLLQEHRRTCGLWSDIIISIPSTPNTLFLVKKSVELDP